MYRQEDMPFSASGLVPDIVINPHAIPSRMTVAQLMECVMGKAAVFLGTFGDATPFSQLSIQDICRVLEDNGIERYGNEILYNSRTGEQLKTTVFIGPTFYQRLKHMVDDKIHSRAASGPVVMLTRQVMVVMMTFCTTRIFGNRFCPCSRQRAVPVTEAYG